MADPKRVDAGGSGVANLTSLLDLLGGQKGTTTTTSDTSSLKDLLGNLQGTNYDQVLQSIFSQAGGKIPGLTAGLSNAVGARTGGNSAVGVQLGKLLQDTVLKGAAQTAQLQQGNQQLQAQVGSAIANGNKTTNTTQGTNTGKAAKSLAVLQLGSKLLGSDTGKQLLAKGKGLFGDLLGNSGGAGADVSSAPSLGFDAGTAFAPNNFSDVGTTFDAAGGIGSGLFDTGNLFSDVGGQAGADAGGAIVDAGSSAGDVAGDINWDSLDLGFADGGLVGRDKPTPINYPSSKTLLPTPEGGTPNGYADGGIVRSGGGRRSSAPTFETPNPTTSSAVQSPTATLNPSRNPRGDLVLPGLDLESGPGIGPSAASEAAGSGTAQSVAVGNAVGQAVANAVMSSVVGPVATIGFNSAAPAIGMAPNQSALSQAISAIANALGIGSSGVNPDGTSDTSPTATGTSSVADAANADSDAGTGDSGTSGVGGDSGGSNGSTSAGGVGGPGDADSGGTGYKSGGEINGKGSGTSDSNVVRVSNGEYIIPADVVNQLGVRFFDELKNHFHTASDVQNAK